MSCGTHEAVSGSLQLGIGDVGAEDQGAAMAASSRNKLHWKSLELIWTRFKCGPWHD